MQAEDHNGTVGVLTEINSKWYLRGDVGFNISGRQESGFAGTSTYEYDDGYGVSIGFGRQENQIFRWDINLEHLMESSSATESSRTFSAIDPLIPASVTVGGKEKFESSYNVFNTMLNGYIDLADIEGFRPYLGAGIGLASLSNSEKLTLTCSAGATVYCENPSGGIGEEVVAVTRDVTAQKWVMSYGLSAGFSYNINRNMMVDFGYQYLNVGGGPFLNYDNNGNSDGVQLHRVKVGLRFKVN